MKCYLSVTSTLMLLVPLATVESSSIASSLQSLDYRYFVAGGTCAAISHGITTPIDVIKTRIQADPKKYDKGMLSATTEIIKSEGTGALLGGLGPTVVGYGVEGAMKFGVYEVMKPIFAELMASVGGANGNTAVAYLMASVVAGAVAAMLLCPMESTRIKVVTDKSYNNLGLLSGLSKMIHEDGLWSSFSGIYAMLAKQIPYTLGKQVSFDIFAGMLYTFFHGLQDSVKLAEVQIKWAVSILAAFLASLVACIFSQPGDMILTETYRPNKKKKGASDRSFVDVVQSIYGTDGLSSFFTGTGARIVHVGVIITSQLVIYDIVKQLLGLPATGSH